MIQLPTAFEFNDKLVIHLAEEVMSPTSGTFLGDSAKERDELKISENTGSFWDTILENEDKY